MGRGRLGSSSVTCGGIRLSPRRAGPILQALAHPEMVQGRLGVELDTAAEFHYRLVEPSPVMQAHAEVEVDRPSFGSSSTALRQARIASSTWPVRQGHADFEVDLGHRRPRRQGGPVEAHRLRRLPLPQASPSA